MARSVFLVESHYAKFIAVQIGENLTLHNFPSPMPLMVVLSVLAAGMRILLAVWFVKRHWKGVICYRYDRRP